MSSVLRTYQPAALSRIDSSRYLGVSLSTLDKLLREEKIKRLHIGRRVLIRLESLDNYLKSLED